MKNIEIDEELYQYIASNTQFIGESASAILRRLLKLGVEAEAKTVTVNESSLPVDVNTLADTQVLTTNGDTTNIIRSSQDAIQTNDTKRSVVKSTEVKVLTPEMPENLAPQTLSTEGVAPNITTFNEKNLHSNSAIKAAAAISRETVFNFINKEELAMQRGAVGRFLLILAALYRAHPAQFSVVTEICGRDRLYFANSESKLAESGSSTKPRQIPESPFWVITNSNTTRKKMMLTKASISLGYSDSDVEKIRELL